MAGGFAAALQHPFLLSLPALSFVGFFAVWPILAFLHDSFINGDSFSLLQYERLWRSASFASVLIRTLSTAIAVTALCIAFAFPLAYALTRVSGGLKTLLIGLVVLPYLTSVIVRTYAWAAILALEGPVNQAMLTLGLISEPILLGHSDFGTHIGMVHILLPVAVLTLWSGLEKIDALHWTVAANLGASRIMTFLTVYLPQSLGALRSAASLVYILSLGAYVIPQTLGSTRGLLFAQLVAEQATALLNWNLAAAMAAVMLFAAGLPIALIALVKRLTRGISRGRAISPGAALVSRYALPSLDRIPERAWTWAWRVAAGLAIIFLLLPEVVVIFISFGPERQITFPPQAYTLAGYASTLTDPSWMEPLRRSAVYAVVGAVIAALLGTLAAYGFARSRPVLGTIGTALLVTPIVLPEIVIAISYFIFANRVGLAGTAAAIVLGQAAAATGLVVVIMSAIVGQLDRNLEYAAAMCGASRTRILREIVLPLILPGLIVGLIYAFLHSFDNLVLPLFISGTNITVPVRMFLSLQEELTSAPAVIATILFVALALGLVAAMAAGRWADRRLPFMRK